MLKLSHLIAVLMLSKFYSFGQRSTDSMWYNIAGDRYTNYKFDEAIYWFSKSIEVGYKIARSYGYKAAAEMLTGKIREAEIDLDAASRVDPTDSYIYFFKGRLFFAKEETDSSIFWCKKAVLSYPSKADFNDELAMAYNQKNIFDSAIKYEEKAFGIEPNNAVYAGNLGFIKLRMERFKDALNDFEFALRLTPEDPTTLTNIAFCKYKLKQYSDALLICDNVLSKNSGFAYAYIVRGQINYDTGQKKNACADFKQVSLIKITEKTGAEYEKKYGCPTSP